MCQIPWSTNVLYLHTSIMQGQEPNGGGWEWSNSDVLSYFNWDGNPSSVVNRGHCGSLSATSGKKWKYHLCIILFKPLLSNWVWPSGYPLKLGNSVWIYVPQTLMFLATALGNGWSWNKGFWDWYCFWVAPPWHPQGPMCFLSPGFLKWGDHHCDGKLPFVCKFKE